MSKTDQPAGVAVDRGVRPISEPLFLLHCGALFGGERDEWDVEANSGRAVDELADQHPGETLHLYALTAEEVAAVNKLAATAGRRTSGPAACGTALGPNARSS